MSKITQVYGREILDSRGNPTVEAVVCLDSGIKAYASVPSGASTGEREALELRDGDPKRYLGKGVLKAISNINTIINSKLVGKSVLDQKGIDYKLIELDGTPNKSRLGANSILGVSLAAAKARALVLNKPLFQTFFDRDQYLLPVPFMNVINGGAHADNSLSFQEYMIVPHGAPSFSEAIRYGVEVFHCLKILLKQKGYKTAVGDEGGFAPDLPHARAAIEVIIEAIQKAGFTVKKDISIALDVAASELYNEGFYVLKSENLKLTSGSFVEYIVKLVREYPIISVEDGMAENDWDGWQLLSNELSDIQLVGDDLFVTNKIYLEKGIKQKIANAILIKLNQVGTLSETLETIEMAKKNNYATMISHRSGETEDVCISDLALGVSAGQIKTGSLCRTERVAKYNQLLRMEKEYSKHMIFAGNNIFKK